MTLIIALIPQPQTKNHPLLLRLLQWLKSQNRYGNTKETGGTADSNTSTSTNSPPPSVDKPIQKEYEALLYGHLTLTSLQTIQIDLALQRDHQHPPFMRVATPTSELEAEEAACQGIEACRMQKNCQEKGRRKSMR
mmetsp:Transcript_8578/g.20658  ORF Transcript_8578/g.20658 Transcript_8578/m.20658 type:complete len:136 (-) Transcript_8578:598-1005(-)